MFKRILPAILLLFCLTGCFNTYIENKPDLPKYSEISPLKTPINVNVDVAAYSNGEVNEAALEQVKPKVLEVLEKTKIFSPDKENDSNKKLQIRVEERADTKAAFGNGFVTGATLGIVGTTSDANYVMNVTLSTNGKDEFSKNYEHILYIGAGMTASKPANAKPVPIADALGTLTEEMLLEFLKDYRK